MASLRDPLQGYDIRVRVIPVSGIPADPKDDRLVGGFNSAMWRIINQTEAYLVVNSRIPRYLDGEVIGVWSLDQGLVNMDVVANTFGGQLAEQYAFGRKNIIPRQTRSTIIIQAGFNTTIHEGTTVGIAGFDIGTFDGDGGPSAVKLQVHMLYARVDTLTFGVAPGKAVTANSWQGTCEGIDDNPNKKSAAATPAAA